tara:strand:- start:580 stop:939 length:360 start_codon:yes stop_codon:yes gene_type:complete
MKLIKKPLLYFFLSLVLTSCGMFDTTVKIYNTYEYNCTTDEFRVLNSDDPILPFLSKNSWYTREEFHDAYVEHILEPYEDMPLSEDTLSQMTPSLETSNRMFDEYKAYVDCENPKDILF